MKKIVFEDKSNIEIYILNMESIVVQVRRKKIVFEDKSNFTGFLIPLQNNLLSI